MPDAPLDLVSSVLFWLLALAVGAAAGYALSWYQNWREERKLKSRK